VLIIAFVNTGLLDMVFTHLKKYTFISQAGLYRLLALSAIVAILGTAGCGSIKPYSAEVVQGNVVTQEQVMALRPGMPRALVKDILGTPLVTSMFHENRWDYVFTIRRKGTEPQQRRLSVYFQGSQLVRIEGDSMPGEAEFAAGIDAKKPTNDPLPLKASEDELAKYPRASNSVSSPMSVEPIQRKKYPPLESASQ
jgi:outer membrane protein assembly factor BamE